MGNLLGVSKTHVIILYDWWTQYGNNFEESLTASEKQDACSGEQDVIIKGDLFVQMSKMFK